MIGKNIYFVGIGGIGMSALAQLLHSRSVAVSGSDRDTSRVTDMLEEKGVRVFIGHSAKNIPANTDTLIYSDAVPEDTVERTWAQKNNITQYSYFEALGEITKDMFTISVAGTHGKTTVTAMLGKILRDAHINPTIVVGSVVEEFNGNFVAGADSAPLVVEACEYQDHLLKLSSNILVVLNLEWDHTDYFKDFNALKETFKKAIAALPENGVLITNLADSVLEKLAQNARCLVVDYSDVSVPALKLLGAFNGMNARAAKTAAAVFAADLDEKYIDESLKTFKGSWRRFEYIGETEKGALVYDDYAHHPTAVCETLTAVREKFSNKKIIVAFHPHLYTRTRDFMDEFGKALAKADEVIVASIYAAREKPIVGITSEVLAGKIVEHKTPAVAVENLDVVLRALKEKDAENVLFITMGAGDIYKVAKKIII